MCGVSSFDLNSGSDAKSDLKPKIVIFSTGGTILSEMDTDSGIVTPKMTGKDLLGNMMGLWSRYDIEIIEHCNMPGSDLDLHEGFKLCNAINEVAMRPDVDGIVVMQGTDTIDEIPYFVSLMLSTEKPVVFTGAMKSAHDFYSDAMGNVLGAACVAASEKSRGRGVLIYFNETVFTAEDIIKLHSSRIDAFEALLGPAGSVVNGKVHFTRVCETPKTYPVKIIETNVPLFKVYTGMENSYIKAGIDSGARGIVIEGYGTGNVPASMLPVIYEALDKNIYVILCTRCIRGESYACYGYPGGGAQLKEKGVILSGMLSGIKSRIKLIVMLSAGCSDEEIRAAFDDGV